MSGDSLHQPHDKLFKQGFRDPETAAGFLRAYLPEAVAAAVDWSQLTLQPGSFVDSQFRAQESDLLFAAPLAGREALLYFLFEHQTQEDPRIALRLLRYMVRIWEERASAQPKRLLPVILPVVLAQNDRVWSVRPRFSTLLDAPDVLAQDLQPFIPDFLFRLIQLAELPFDAIRGTPAGIMMMRVMKAERSNQLDAAPVWDEDMLRQIPQAVFEMLLRYLMDADVDTTRVERHVWSIQAPELRNTAMTLAQKLRQEGRQEGTLLALQAAVIDALAIRFARVPDGLREEIARISDPVRLQALLRAAIQAGSVEEFAKSL